jgi:hypothetical protein
MPWSNDVLTKVVTGSYTSPSGAPAKGRITFKPAVEVFDKDDAIVIRSPIIATLDDTGSFSVELPTTDNPLLKPSNWLYEVNVRLYGVKPRKFYTEVRYTDGEAASFITTASSLGSSSATVTGQTTSLQGPVGPRGPGLVSGEGAPVNNIGTDGDIYIDTLTGAYYGPKAAGSWPTSAFFTAGNAQRYTHTQSSPSSTWNVTHTLGGRPSVTVVDSSGTVVIGEVTYNSNTSVTIQFTAPFSGYAYLT